MEEFLRGHRNEAAALLTGYGQSPGDFDFTMFLNERASGRLISAHPFDT
jgi:hypothetical protein